MIRRTSRIVYQLLILTGLSQFGYWLTGWLALPLPGNVLGMLLLFALLWSGAIPLRLVEDTALLLLRHLAFFFVPIAVGLMNYGGLLRDQGVALLLILIGSAACGIVATGFVSGLLSLPRSREAT